MSSNSGHPYRYSKSGLSPSADHEDDTTIPDPYDPATDNPFETPLPDIQEPGDGIWGRERPVKDPGPEQDPRPAPRTGGGATQASAGSTTQRGGCPLCSRWRCSCGIRGDRNDPSSGMGVPPQGSVAASESSGTSSRCNSMSTSNMASSISSFYSGQAAPLTATTGKSSQPRQNVYFVLRDGIDREVITADICRYLGNDAVVRPHFHQDAQTGQLLQGYQVTAYRNLTFAMVQDLKMDSSRWDQEKRKYVNRPGRYGDYGARGAAQYPGRDAPGYTGSNFSTTSRSENYNAQTSGYSNFPDDQQQVPNYSQLAVASAGYPQVQAGYSSTFSQQSTPFVNVGARCSAESNAASGMFYASGDPYPQGQDSMYGYHNSQAQMQSAYTQPTDPFFGRDSSQADYDASAPTTHQQISDNQHSQGQGTSSSGQVTSSSTSTRAWRPSGRTSDAQKPRRRKER